MSRVSWEFYDPAGNDGAGETYYWVINPSGGGYPSRSKGIAYNVTAAPDGQTVAFEGREAPMSLSFTGTILYESQFNTMTDWFNKRNQIRLTDDLGRQFWIYIKTFNAERVRAASHPWKHSYTMEAIVLDWA